jgi:hypothetical protein
MQELNIIASQLKASTALVALRDDRERHYRMIDGIDFSIGEIMREISSGDLKTMSIEQRKAIFDHVDGLEDVQALRRSCGKHASAADSCLKKIAAFECSTLGDMLLKYEIANAWLQDDDTETYADENAAMLNSFYPLLKSMADAPAAPAEQVTDEKAAPDLDAVYWSVREGLALVRLVQSGLHAFLNEHALGFQICDGIRDMEQACVVASRSLSRCLETLDDLGGLQLAGGAA